MKKIFSVCIALIVSFLMVSSVFAAEVKVDKVIINEDNVTLSVVLTELPDGLSAIHGLQIKYTYDSSVLEYKSGMSTLLNKGGLEVNAKDGKGNVVWLDMNVADEATSKKITPEMLEEHNGKLFELEFTKIDSSAEETSIVIDYVRITESIGGGDFNAVTADDLTVTDGVIKFVTSEDDDTTGDDNTGDDNTGDDNTGGDNTGGDNTGGDSTGGDNTGGDNTGDDTTGGDNTGDDNTGDDTTGGDNTGDDTTGGSNTGSNDNNNNGGGGKGSGGKGSGSGGVSMPVVPVTPVTPTKNFTFSDVKDTDWYYEAVKFAFEKGITSGVSETSYAPDDKVTRGQFITMLCRAYDIKEMTGDNFADCGDTWYTGYLAAAKQLGISNGVGDNKFDPEKEISREEMVTLIYNYLKSVGKVDTETTETSFADDASISSWAKNGVAFANSMGYVKGKGDNLFDPNGDATRAELAQIFFNMFK